MITLQPLNTDASTDFDAIEYISAVSTLRAITDSPEVVILKLAGDAGAAEKLIGNTMGRALRVEAQIDGEDLLQDKDILDAYIKKIKSWCNGHSEKTHLEKAQIVLKGLKGIKQNVSTFLELNKDSEDEDIANEVEIYSRMVNTISSEIKRVEEEVEELEENLAA